MTSIEDNKAKKWIIALAIIAGIFFCTTLIFGYKAFLGKPTMNKEYVKTEAERLLLQSELDTLMAQHDKLKIEYGDLAEQLSAKDSVIQSNAEEIKKLIQSQADYGRIKKQLARLQNIAKEYVEEMDKLYQENKVLKEENTQVKETLRQEKEKVALIEKDKQNLHEKINEAAILKAYNISGQAFNLKGSAKKEEVTEKANRAERFKVSCTLGENSLIVPGPVNVYCRIAIPETGRVLAIGDGDAYAFSFNGQKLQYSDKTTINYTGKTEKITLQWDIRPGDKVLKGRYAVEIYTDNQLLGETYIILK
jgi:hypothetical protein